MSEAQDSPSPEAQPETAEAAETAKPVKRKGLRRVLIAGQMLVGVGLGLVITEKVFASRAEQAFPHVNFYVEDAELGVRLRPGATMNFRFRDNPLSHIEINSQGYRGGEWPAPDLESDNEEIIVIGDSQVFGLGVEAEESFAAQLEALTGRPVLNAGVPTYGPPEYMAIAKELLAARKPKTLVVTMNFLNDPFELGRPNADRHAVWDGWAVRAENAPGEVREFPGRAWLYSQSHAFYALRRWQHERGKSQQAVVEGVDFGTPSEGGFSDLVGESAVAHAARAEQAAKLEAEQGAGRERLDKLESERADKRDKLDKLLHEFTEYDFDGQDAHVARGRPGDIVEVNYGESSRSVELTAALIRAAARERKRYLGRLLAKKRGNEASEAKALVEADTRLASERDALRRQIAAGVPLLPPPPSLFGPFLDELAAACAEQGTELVVVALPVDVQVDAAEWDKYGVEARPDMSESLVLLTDFVNDAQARGIRAVDVTQALRGAEPGAFLDHDIHMTPKGHEAFAQALAARLEAPMPLEAPAPGLPDSLHFVPERRAWAEASQITVTGSSKLGCRTMYEQGWLHIACARRKKYESFRHVEVLEGGKPTTMAVSNPDGLSLVTPVAPGERVRARFEFRNSVQELSISWSEGEDGTSKLGGAFVKLEGEPREAVEVPEVAALCACKGDVDPDAWVVSKEDGYYGYGEEIDPVHWDWEKSCGSMWLDLALGPACRATHGEACGPALWSCMQHDPLFAPECPEGQVHAFASNACFAACDEAHACAEGSCTPWQGGGVCMEGESS